MSKEKNFKPQITRVKLNPEQAVLQCDCYQGQLATGPWQPSPTPGLCSPTSPKTFWPGPDDFQTGDSFPTGNSDSVGS